MSTNHAAVAALPITAPASQTLLRNLAVARMPYVLADTDTPTDLVAVDPMTGAAIVDITYLGRLFHYDPTDSTTPNDGVTCLVSNEGRRYKLANNTDVTVWGVLSKTPTAPPGSPSLGDSYLVPAGATGAWAGKGGYVAVKTARGWEFVLFGIGRLLYVEDIDTYYRRNAAGVWIAGFGASALSANSVTLLNVLGAKASFVIKVENQTTTAPPASPTAPTAYIIGPAATGAWAGQDGKLAICIVNGSFTIIAPDDGDEVYDKSQKTFYTFRSSAWQAEAGAWVAFRSQFTAAAVTVGVSGTTYSYSTTVAPTTGNAGLPDPTTITHTARKTGALLRFRYSSRVDTASMTGGTDTMYVVGLFRDSVVNALAWEALPVLKVGSSGPETLKATSDFVVSAVDASAHTYQIRVIYAGSFGLASIDRRLFTLEEAS